MANSLVQLFGGFYSTQVYFRAHRKTVAAIILNKMTNLFVIKEKICEREHHPKACTMSNGSIVA